MGTLILILTVVVFCAAFMWIASKVPLWVYCGICAVWCTFWAVLDIFTGDQTGVALNSLIASYWWNRFFKSKPPKMRDKVAKLIGAKAKAVKDKVVAAMPKASPVRVPALVGAS